MFGTCRVSQPNSAGWLADSSAFRSSAVPAREAASIIAAPSAVKPLVMPAYDIFIAEAAPIGPGWIGISRPYLLNSATRGAPSPER